MTDIFVLYIFFSFRATAVFCQMNVHVTTMVDFITAMTPSLRTATHGNVWAECIKILWDILIINVFFLQRYHFSLQCVQWASLALWPLCLCWCMCGNGGPTLCDVRRSLLLFPGWLPVRVSQGDQRLIQRHGGERAVWKHGSHLHKISHPQSGKHGHTSSKR